MSEAIVNRAVMKEALYQFNANGPIVVHLFTNDDSVTVNSLIGDFTEAAYPGYPTGGDTITVTPIVPAGNEEAYTTVGVSFPAPTSAGSDTIFGFWVDFYAVSAAARQVLMAASFGTPVVLTYGGDALPLLIDLSSLDLNNP